MPWDEIEDHMHLPLTLKEGGEVDFEDLEEVASRAKRYARQMASDDELMAIFERTYGPVRRSAPGGVRKPARKPPTEAQFSGGHRVKQKTKTPTGPLYVLVDGYNLIHAWPELADVARRTLGQREVASSTSFVTIRGLPNMKSSWCSMRTR